MKQILIIEVSPRETASASRAVAETLATRLTALYPSVRLSAVTSPQSIYRIWTGPRSERSPRRTRSKRRG